MYIIVLACAYSHMCAGCEAYVSLSPTSQFPWTLLCSFPCDSYILRSLSLCCLAQPPGSLRGPQKNPANHTSGAMALPSIFRAELPEGQQIVVVLVGFGQAMRGHTVDGV